MWPYVTPPSLLPAGRIHKPPTPNFQHHWITLRACPPSLKLRRGKAGERSAHIDVDIKRPPVEAGHTPGAEIADVHQVAASGKGGCPVVHILPWACTRHAPFHK